MPEDQRQVLDAACPVKNPDSQAPPVSRSSPNAENAAAALYGGGAEWPNQVSGTGKIEPGCRRYLELRRAALYHARGFFSQLGELHFVNLEKWDCYVSDYF